MTPKIEFFGQVLAYFGGFEGLFLTILGRKIRFLDFFKDGLE